MAVRVALPIATYIDKSVVRLSLEISMIFFPYGAFFDVNLQCRFNAHLGKKGISGHIKVSYENKTLSIEVIDTAMLRFLQLACPYYYVI